MSEGRRPPHRARSRLAREWAARLRDAYGGDPGPGARVMHAAAVAAAPEGRLPVLASGPHGPRCAADAFALESARARADAILTTGEILRREPGLAHTLGPAAAAWRREVLGKDRPPLGVVLTRQSRASFAHALFSPERAALLPMRTATIAEAVRRLEEEHGIRSLLVEAGPRTARELYAAPGDVDELLLSIYEGPLLPPAALVGEFATRAAIERLLGSPVHERVETVDGVRWRFCRFRRS